VREKLVINSINFNHFHNKLYVKHWLVVVVFCIFHIQVNAQQNLPNGNSIPQEFSNIKVEELSDQQVLEFKQQADQRGLNQQQLTQFLKSRGMSDSEVQKLKIRINSISSNNESNFLSTERIDREKTLTPDQNLAQILNAEYEQRKLSEFQSKIFGFSLFNQPDLTFEPSYNMPTPENYLIGPNDEIVIDVWGASEANYRLPVNPEGYILVRNLGPIYLNGLSVVEARRRIVNRLTEIYAGLRGSNPNTFAQVSLGNVRSIKVSIIGEVNLPGTYTMSSLASVFNALYAAGGPSVNGTFRQIHLLRNGEIKESIDLYDFLVDGEEGSKITLQDQDIIKVGPYLNRVNIDGEVKREEVIYELIPGETLNDLVKYAGGFTDKAFTATIKINRNTAESRKIVDVPKSAFDLVEMHAGDEVNVEPILNRFDNRVQIQGAVFREGAFQLDQGLTLLQLIEKAEGLRGDAFLERATIYRANDDYTTSVVAVNLRDVIDNPANDVNLQREDLVKINSIYDLSEEFYVQVNGEIKSPGTYPWMKKMDVKDLIVMAGGLLESASSSHLEIARRHTNQEERESSRIAEIYTIEIDKGLELTGEDGQFELEPFDIVYIRKSPGYERQQTVKMEGEVLFPGFYGIARKNERVSDLIKRSGGFTDDAYLKGATLIRRTEFFDKKSDNEIRNEQIQSLKTRKMPIESEEKRKKRLDNVKYSAVEDEVVQGSIIRQQRIESLEAEQEDSLATGQISKNYETIGIALEEIMQNPGSKYDLILEDGDILSIPRQLQTVRLRGELLYPITVRYDDGKGFMRYVSQAGGFTSDAKKNKAYVVYANGSVDRTKKFLFFKDYPKIEPGAEIIIPTKPEKEKVSVQQWAAVTSILSTLTIVFVTLNNNL